MLGNLIYTTRRNDTEHIGDGVVRSLSSLQPLRPHKLWLESARRGKKVSTVTFLSRSLSIQRPLKMVSAQLVKHKR